MGLAGVVGSARQARFPVLVEAVFCRVGTKPNTVTNFDPAGFLLLLTVVPALAAGAISISLAHLVAGLGYGEYDTNVVVLLAALVGVWTVAAVAVSTSMLQILAVVLAMVGAFGVTRSVRAASYGWVLGVVLLFGAFVALSAVGVYRGVDQTGRPQGFIAEHLQLFYYGGLLAFGAIGGKLVAVVGQ